MTWQSDKLLEEIVDLAFAVSVPTAELEYPTFMQKVRDLIFETQVECLKNSQNVCECLSGVINKSLCKQNISLLTRLCPKCRDGGCGGRHG